VAQIELPAQLQDKQELPVSVVVSDPKEQVVFTAVIRIWVTRKAR
jgi:hypothetical protein